LQMQPGGWEVDSDDESDNEWLDELAQAVSTSTSTSTIIWSID
jgi:hypothetical protein